MFHLENRATHFIEAISSLQQLVSTGVLKDRSGYRVDQARLPRQLPPELKKIKSLLARIRSLATDSLSRAIIVEHEAGIEIRDPSIQMQLNQLRADVVVNLNKLLATANIEPIEEREC